MIVSMGYNHVVWCNNFFEGRARVQETELFKTLMSWRI